MDVGLLSKINDSVDNWHKLSQNERLETIRKLKSVAQVTPCQLPRESELSCPEFGYRLSHPCSLSKCAFHINSPKNFNCIYHGLDGTKKRRMTANDVASCMGMTISEVNSNINSAVLKIRMVKVGEEIASSRPNHFRYNEGHCVNCGVYIQDELDLNESPGLTIEFGKHGYCSEECKKAKPVWKFQLEHRYQTDWEYVVITTLEYLSTIKASNKDIEQLLGVDPYSLGQKDQESMRRYKSLML